LRSLLGLLLNLRQLLLKSRGLLLNL